MFRQLNNFSRSRASNFIAFVWGLAEGVFFFIVPDVYIGFMSLVSFKSGIFSVFYVLLGSLLSAILVFIIHGQIGSRMSELLLYVPGINASMLTKVSNDLSAQGLSALITGPLFGIPYKIYTTFAAQLSFRLTSYLLWSIPARLERLTIIFIIAALSGRLLRKSIEKHPILASFCYIFIWIGIYVAYFAVINEPAK